MRTDAFLLAIAVLALSQAACDDLSSYRAVGGSSGVYRGAVIGSDGDSFIRRGFAAGTELTLTFDPSLASSPSPPPGTITTSDLCMGLPSFDNTPLEPILPLAHDQLSQLEFPGGGRIRNFMFSAHATAGCLAGRDAVVIVSLMDGGVIEVRVIVGTGDEARGDRFGVFVTGKVAS
jgi:hypothetical protein